MSSPEFTTDSSSEQLDLVEKIDTLQKELKVKRNRLAIANVQAPLFHDTAGVFHSMSSLSKEIEALEDEIETLQLKLDALKTDSDPTVA